MLASKRKIAQAILEKERRRELIRCKEEPFYWLRNYVLTNDPHDDINPIKPFPVEKPYITHLWKILFDQRLLLIEKTRQMQVTWTVCAFITWWCQFIEAQVVFIQSKKEEDSDALLKRCKFIHERQPDWMIERILGKGKVRDVYCHFDLPNLSTITAIAQGGDQLRQHTASIIFSDEMSVQDQSYDAFIASKPTISGGGRFIGVGTPSPGFMKQLVYDELEEILS